MEEKKVEKVDIQNAGIDKDVLEAITKDLIEKTVNDQTLLNRAIVNCLAETISELKNVSRSLNNFYQVISICSQEKILEYFGELDKNVKAEEKRLIAQQKIHQDHKKKK